MIFWKKQGFICLWSALLVGCSLIKTPATGPSPASATRNRSDGTLPVLPPAGSGRGGYYQDDGPGDNPPPDLLATPDAEPRLEPYLARANKPYAVFGQTYTPTTDARPFKQRGVGSWYGKKFHGQKTSSGELYDMYKMTAAHPTLPIPSYARVTNLNNGAQVIVRINDRGPFHSSRIIDLSYTAALKLGYLGHGSGLLEVERLLPDEIAHMANHPPTPTEPPPAATQPPAVDTATIGNPSATDASGFYLQFGTYQQSENAQAMGKLLTQKWGDSRPPIEIVEYGVFYRLQSGPFATRAEATSAAQRVQDAGLPKPVIVQR